ncbi:MAG: YkvA family protein [Vicinamibacterales bacterium]
MPSVWRFGAFWTLLREARLVLRLLREPRVPAAMKLLPGLALLYVLVPVDFIPDLIAVFGQIDDVSLLLAAASIFRRLVPTSLVAYHQSAMSRKQRYAPMPSDEGVIDV